MSGIILVYLVGPYTFLGQLFDGHLTNSLTGVVIAMTFVASPFLVVAARSAFATSTRTSSTSRPPSVTASSRASGVVVPARRARDVRAGMVLTWLRAFGEYGAVVVLAYNPSSLPIYTYNQFSGAGLPTTLAPTALAARRRGRRRPPRPRCRFAPRASRSTSPERPTPALRRRPVAPVAFDIDRRPRLLPSARRRPDRTPPPGRARTVRLGQDRAAALRWRGSTGRARTRVRRRRARPGVAVEGGRVGYVAQGFSLFPHLNVWQQLTLPARGSTPELAAYWLAHLRLEGLESRIPAELSGGQRQRVGLAQVLCRSPRVLLLDEPFSALDVPVRLELRRELRRLQRDTGLATVLVTHDPEEAAFLADDLLVLARGEVQSPAPAARSSRAGVARGRTTLGVANVFDATVASSSSVAILDALVTPGDQAAPGRHPRALERPTRAGPRGRDAPASRVTRRRGREGPGGRRARLHRHRSPLRGRGRARARREVLARSSQPLGVDQASPVPSSRSTRRRSRSGRPPTSPRTVAGSPR